MRSLPHCSIVALGVLLGAPQASLAADAANASVVVNVQFSTRTSLKVSSDVLHFDVARPSEPALAAVDFSAAARTQSGAEVVLSVEPLRGVEGPGGAADVESSLTVEAAGAGTVSGVVAPDQPTIAGRWIGSGVHAGRLLFSLRAAASGTYTVPMRFVLSAP
jgi:hypothetical protein